MIVQLNGVYSGFLGGMEVPSELTRKLRRADDFIRLGVLAGHRLLKQHAETDTVDGDTCGLVLGTSFGPMETNFEVLDQVVSGEQTSPTMFSHSVFNSAAGYMASTLGIKGCGLTITDFDFPFFRALEQGYMTLLSGRLTLCLVLQVETYSMLLQDAKAKHASESEPWKPGVVCWLLQRKETQDGEQFGIESLRIQTNHCRREKYLQFEEQLSIGSSRVVGFSPLDVAGLVGSNVRAADKKSILDCQIESRYGSVHLVLRR